MACYIVTGKLGAGKTLAMVGRARDYLWAGRPVATNIGLDLSKLVPDAKKPVGYWAMPDRPTVDALEALPVVHDTALEERNGALILDECAAWMNARQWNDKLRHGLIDWMLHARKRGWDVYLITQQATLIDKQIRDVLSEYVVTCRRLDRLTIPLFGTFGRILTAGTWSGKFPQIHVAVVRYGSSPTAPIAETWTYRGRELYGAYKSSQIIGDAGTLPVWSEWDPRPPGRVQKPKARAVQLAEALPRDEAWAWARRYAASLDRALPASTC